MQIGYLIAIYDIHNLIRLQTKLSSSYPPILLALVRSPFLNIGKMFACFQSIGINH